MTNEKRKVGRPLTYSKSIIEKAKQYIHQCKDVEGDKEKGLNTKVNIPTKGGLAVALGVSRETLYAWAGDYEEFSDIMEELGSIQEERLINNGLSGAYNPTITKVLLTKHGYNDKIDTDFTSGGKRLDSSITNIINKIYGSNGDVFNDSEESE